MSMIPNTLELRLPAVATLEAQLKSLNKILSSIIKILRFNQPPNLAENTVHVILFFSGNIIINVFVHQLLDFVKNLVQVKEE